MPSQGMLSFVSSRGGSSGGPLGLGVGEGERAGGIGGGGGGKDLVKDGMKEGQVRKKKQQQPRRYPDAQTQPSNPQAQNQQHPTRNRRHTLIMLGPLTLALPCLQCFRKVFSAVKLEVPPFSLKPFTSTPQAVSLKPSPKKVPKRSTFLEESYMSLHFRLGLGFGFRSLSPRPKTQADKGW